jgi:protein-L-isoaspartate(D-aspartate) O-methyltransferase
MQESNSLKPDSDDELRFEKLRQQMVERQLAHRGICDPRVLMAMSSVPRHHFVPRILRNEAYDDCPLPIGFGQTISQPLTVAWMAQALQLEGHERILDIGTGSGYGAAVLSLLAREVHTVELIPELAERAAKCLADLGYSNVTVHINDGTLGLPEQAPFDAIVVAAAGDRLPPPYIDQLAEGGRILIPIGKQASGQHMIRYTLDNGTLKNEDLGRFAFVPLLGKFGTDSIPPVAADDF